MLTGIPEPVHNFSSTFPELFPDRKVSESASLQGAHISPREGDPSA